MGRASHGTGGSRSLKSGTMLFAVATMPIGSEPLFSGTAPGRISHQKEIGPRPYASVRNYKIVMMCRPPVATNCRLDLLLVMARFYFNYRQADCLVPDDEGRDLPDEEAARQ